MVMRALNHWQPGRPLELKRADERAAAVDDRTIGQVCSVGSKRPRAAHLRQIPPNQAAFLSLARDLPGGSADATAAACDLRWADPFHSSVIIGGHSMRILMMDSIVALMSATLV